MSNENDVFTVADIDARIDEIFGPEPTTDKPTDDSDSLDFIDNELDRKTEVKSDRQLVYFVELYIKVLAQDDFGNTLVF